MEFGICKRDCPPVFVVPTGGGDFSQFLKAGAKILGHWLEDGSFYFPVLFFGKTVILIGSPEDFEKVKK